jgi:hypothetical protein
LVWAGQAVSQLVLAVAAQAREVSFIARRDFASGLLPYSVAVGDFNGDGAALRPPGYMPFRWDPRRTT